MYHRYLRNENGTYRHERVDVPQVPPSRPTKPSAAPGEAKQSRPIQLSLPLLERLLPDADNGDLLVMLILLLLLAEGSEDSSSMVLTLAIFLFLQ